MLGRWIHVAVLCTVASPSSGLGQSNDTPARSSRGWFALHIEPVAIGAQYGWAVGRRWHVGPQVIVGPFEGVSLHRTFTEPLKEWVSAYVTVRYSLGRGAALAVAPVGVTLVVGDDFGVFYPTGQIGVDYRTGPWLVGSDLRIIRIAGPNGTGDYWTQWIPARIGIAFGGRRGSDPPD